MKMTVVNKEIQIGHIKIDRASSASLVLFGDTEAILGSAYYDTPKDSLIISPKVPLTGTGKEETRFPE